MENRRPVNIGFTTKLAWKMQDDSANSGHINFNADRDGWLKIKHQQDALKAQREKDLVAWEQATEKNKVIFDQWKSGLIRDLKDNGVAIPPEFNDLVYQPGRTEAFLEEMKGKRVDQIPAILEKWFIL